MPANVLFERDTNLPQAATTNSKPQGEKKPMSMEYHRQVLESRMKNGEQQQTYVSPSDNIQSPATQKLAAFKNKRLDKSIKPKTSLFARTATKNAEARSGANMFADMPKEAPAAESNEQTAA